MNTIEPSKSIVPIIRYSEKDPIKEILGTGAVIGCGEDIYILTAKHVFGGAKKQDDEGFGFVLNDAKRKRISVFAIQRIVATDDYDVAICFIQYVEGMVPLQFSREQPSLNSDVICYEYSSTRIETKNLGGKHVTFEPLAHKGNIMRYFDSEFPEKVKTPSFNTSFPALQGASGAPVLAATKNKHFYIAGIMVANQETHLIPAQILEVTDGNKYMEKTKYFLPMGKAINASLVAPIIEGLDLKIEYVE